MEEHILTLLTTNSFDLCLRARDSLVLATRKSVGCHILYPFAVSTLWLEVLRDTRFKHYPLTYLARPPYSPCSVILVLFKHRVVYMCILVTSASCPTNSRPFYHHEEASVCQIPAPSFKDPTL